MNISQIEKRHIFRLFAAGNTPDQVADMLNSTNRDSADNRAGSKPDDVATHAPNAAAHIDILCIEELYEKYLAMPMSEKLRQTLLTEQVSNRLHRLMDDIADLKLVDELLKCTDEETIVSLLDIKRKIKERMANEDAPPSEGNGSSESSQRNLKGVLDECFNRVYNVS